jgi:hypothetical protein
LVAFTSSDKASSIVFINGKIGGGSPPAGRPFWETFDAEDPGFVQGAIDFFKTNDCHFPLLDFSPLSTVRDRFQQGYEFWDLADFNPHALIHIVAHSMGCAFAEGFLKAATKAGYKVGLVLHLNPYQAQALAISTKRWFTIDYQLEDDPLINNPFLKVLGHAQTGAITGADYQLRVRSGIPNPLKKHRAPIARWGYQFWPHLSNLLPNKESGGEWPVESF